MGLDMYLFKKKKTEKKSADNWKEIAYWRKANQIHKWFVDNVQGGTDDCGDYEVNKEQLEKLRDTCVELLNKIVLTDGKVQNGMTFNNDKWEPIMEDGKIISNPEVCEKILPTQDGFFFGTTNYDQYYYSDITDTVAQLNKILSDTDFENEDITYTSSW